MEDFGEEGRERSNANGFDFIENFIRTTEGIPSPEVFRLWAAISTLGAAAERKISTRINSRLGEVYPNFFTLLVGGPAVGKTQAIDRARMLLRASKKTYIAPKGITKAAMLDRLAKSKRVIVENGMLQDEYHSLFCGSGEFGVLVPAHDLEFLNVLNDIYDNPAEFDDETRTSKSVYIAKPQLSILAGTQPAYLAAILPDEAWSMGFMSRVLMVYAASGPQLQLFDDNNFEINEIDQSKHLIDYLVQLSSLRGSFKWSPEAVEDLRAWYRAGQPPVPQHTRLSHYLGRRLMSIVKLSMIASLSHSLGLRIERNDLARAFEWLFAIEAKMPDVFREMTQKSDAITIQELYHFTFELFMRGGKKPVHESRIFRFLSTRVPSDKILRIIEIALRMNILSKPTAETYIPKAREDSNENF